MWVNYLNLQNLFQLLFKLSWDLNKTKICGTDVGSVFGGVYLQRGSRLPCVEGLHFVHRLHKASGVLSVSVTDPQRNWRKQQWDESVQFVSVASMSEKKNFGGFVIIKVIIRSLPEIRNRSGWSERLVEFRRILHCLVSLVAQSDLKFAIPPLFPRDYKHSVRIFSDLILSISRK